jgi:hypothetical protein
VERASGDDVRHRSIRIHRIGVRDVGREGATPGCLLEKIEFGLLLIACGIGSGCRTDEQEMALGGCDSSSLQQDVLLVSGLSSGHQVMLGGVVVLVREQLLVRVIGLLLEEEMVGASRGGDEQVDTGALCLDEQQVMVGRAGLGIEQLEVVLRGRRGLQQKMMMRACRRDGEEMMGRARRALEQKMRVRSGSSDSEQMVGGSCGCLEQQMGMGGCGCSEEQMMRGSRRLSQQEVVRSGGRSDEEQVVMRCCCGLLQ